MGASRYMAVENFVDEHDREYERGSFITGTQYERLGEPNVFKPADYPSEVDQLREEYGLDDPDEEQLQADALAGQPTVEGEPDLDGLSVAELRELAAERDIAGRSDMKRQELLDALRQQ